MLCSSGLSIQGVAENYFNLVLGQLCMIYALQQFLKLVTIYRNVRLQSTMASVEEQMRQVLQTLLIVSSRCDPTWYWKSGISSATKLC